MSYKISTYVSLIILMILSLIVLITSGDLTSAQDNQPISPATFPRIVAVLILIVSGISFYTTYRKDDEKVELANFKYVILTIVASVVFLTLWQLVGAFFILSFLLLAFLFYLYSDQPNWKRKLIVSLITASIVTGFIYIVFTNLLGVYF